MKVEKGIEMPERRYSSKYPWGEMDVGDSVLVDGSRAAPGECIAYNSAISFGHRHGMKFAGRKERSSPGKVRIWRIK